MTNGIVIGLSALAGVWMGWYSIPICLSVLVMIRLIECNKSPGIFVVCLLFAVVGSARSQTPPSITTNADLSPSTGAVGKVVSFPRPTSQGHRALFRVTELCVGEQCIPANALVLVEFPEQVPPVSRGQVTKITWEFQSLQNLSSGFRSYVSSQGAEGSARATSVRTIHAGPMVYRWIAQANATVADNMQSAIPGDAGALATGIVTGDDSRLTPEMDDMFQTTGTSHITAVSGQNVSLIIGFLSFWYRPARPGTRLIFHLILIAAVWSFTVFVGMESPALRAAIVATLSILGNHVGRKPDPVTLLSLTLGFIALVQPLVVHSVGFWLSAVAAMALCMVLPKRISRSNARSLWKAAAGPMVASIATMPIALASFGVWSPIGILANILVAPAMTLAFPLAYGFALLGLVAPSVAHAFAFVPTIPLAITLVIVESLAPVAMQIRVDTVSPRVLFLLWIPIAIGIWLLSDESQRWIRRVLTVWQQRPKIRESKPV